MKGVSNVAVSRVAGWQEVVSSCSNAAKENSRLLVLLAKCVGIHSFII